MAKILNVISAVSPMGGTITKLRALMKNSTNEHFMYQPGYDITREEIESEHEYYSTINVNAYYGIYNRNIIAHVREINRIVRKHQIEIIHFYFNFENSFAPLIRLFNPQIKMVRSIVGFDKELPWYRKLLVDFSFRWVDNYVFISKYIKYLYEETYPILKKKSSRIIYNGAVNVHELTTSIEQKRTLVTTSGLCERKNVYVLIEAMNIIKNKYNRDDIVLNILGDGPERSKIEKLIREYNISSIVHLVGYTRNVADYLNECAIYVHPATTEGFGIAVTEAMQMYCPCIVADKGALPELVVDGYNGYVVDAFSPQIWSEKILYLMDNNNIRYTYSLNSHKRAISSFSLEAFIENHDRMYNQLMEK